jgi:hypothetical protein
MRAFSVERSGRICGRWRELEEGTQLRTYKTEKKIILLGNEMQDIDIFALQ